MSAPPLSLAWLVHVRDNENLTVYEFALGSLYATCGEGKRIFLSDKGAADILSIKRDTAAKARKGLLAKGLIEDTGQHGSQPQQREYRLTVPVEMPPRRKVRGDVPETGTPCTPNGHPDVPETGTGVVPIRAQHQEVDLEVDLDEHQHHGQDQLHDDGCQEDPENQDQGQGQNPRPAGADKAPGNKPYEFDSEDREHWAGLLGVPLSSIRESFWTWYGHRVNEMHDKSYDGCRCGCDGGPCQAIVSGACTHPDEDCPCLCPTSGTVDCECPCPTSGKKKDCQCQCEHDGYWDIAVQAGVAAARDASVKGNPVGYFQTVLMQKVDLTLYRAKSRAA